MSRWNVATSGPYPCPGDRISQLADYSARGDNDPLAITLHPSVLVDQLCFRDLSFAIPGSQNSLRSCLYKLAVHAHIRDLPGPGNYIVLTHQFADAVENLVAGFRPAVRQIRNIGR